MVYLVIRHNNTSSRVTLTVWKTLELAAAETCRVCQDSRITVTIHALPILTEAIETT